jgi:hypothetical protein
MFSFLKELQGRSEEISLGIGQAFFEAIAEGEAVASSIEPNEEEKALVLVPDRAVTIWPPKLKLDQVTRPDAPTLKTAEGYEYCQVPAVIEVEQLLAEIEQKRLFWEAFLEAHPLTSLEALKGW